MQMKSLEGNLKYLNFKNKLIKIILVSEKMYYEEKLNIGHLKGNNRGTWKFINNILWENTSSFKQSSIKEIVSEAKFIKYPSKFNDFLSVLGHKFSKKIYTGVK